MEDHQKENAALRVSGRQKLLEDIRSRARVLAKARESRASYSQAERDRADLLHLLDLSEDAIADLEADVASYQRANDHQLELRMRLLDPEHPVAPSKLSD